MKIRSNTKKCFCLSLLAGFALAHSLRAEEALVLRQGFEGYTGCLDTYICKENPSQNFNVGNDKYTLLLRKVAGGTTGRLGLVRWALPTDDLATREILSAKIVLFVQENPYDRQDHQQVGVFPLKRAWEPSEVTWQQASLSVNWALEGAQGTEDIVFPAAAEAEARAEDRYRVEFQLPLDLVKQWVSNPLSNHGVLIKFTDDRPDLSLHFYPSETPAKDQEMRPTLEIVLK
jgi:hypothetical protein